MTDIATVAADTGEAARPIAYETGGNIPTVLSITMIAEKVCNKEGL